VPHAACRTPAKQESLNGFHALYLGGQRVPRRVRVFLDFMVPRLQAFMGAAT
jgi:hypothetical protein